MPCGAGSSAPDRRTKLSWYAPASHRFGTRTTPRWSLPIAAPFAKSGFVPREAYVQLVSTLRNGLGRTKPKVSVGPPLSARGRSVVRSELTGEHDASPTLAVNVIVPVPDDRLHRVLITLPRTIASPVPATTRYPSRVLWVSMRSPSPSDAMKMSMP